jgi:hypothetical protein
MHDIRMSTGTPAPKLIPRIVARDQWPLLLSALFPVGNTNNVILIARVLKTQLRLHMLMSNHSGFLNSDDTHVVDFLLLSEAGDLLEFDIVGLNLCGRISVRKDSGHVRNSGDDVR